MTFREYANEIKGKIESKQKFKKFYGEKTASVYLNFYEDEYTSVTYKMDAYDWERVKELINKENKII